MQTIAGLSNLRYFFYGGAVRGGKTSVCLTILILLAKKFKGSRWHIIRDSLTTLQETTIPSMERFCPPSKYIKWNRDKSDYNIHFLESNSKIYMTSESFTQDPQLLWMDGLETNGIFLEQMEGLSQQIFNKARERTGSWLINPMPPGLILGTFNPTQKWVKPELYEKHRNGELKPPFYFLEALPTDNPLVTEDQWNAWKTLDKLSYAARIEGNWDSFTIEKPFAYCFDEKKHILDYDYDPSYELQLSFDFNVDPITCIVSQFIDNRIRIIKEFRLSNSNIYELCERIKVEYPNALYLITGDATGHNRTALTSGTMNYYTVIQSELNCSDGQMKQPSINPSINDSRVLLNSILQNFPPAIHSECKYLIEDLKYVEVDDNGDINKTKDKHRSHLLDCLRYSLNTFYSYLLNINHVEN